ncbi:hypothetical protein AB0L13_38960 [Saccharopolyspora shandongensis]|uniref:hypothetical protein n=1 Tax=Saccharopolyspora shandongensis TaxID=418495 RepID=UPI003424982D
MATRPTPTTASNTLLCGDVGRATSPRPSSTPTGTGARLLIGEQPYSVYQGGQTCPPPSALTIADPKGTRANQLFWFALA